MAITYHAGRRIQGTSTDFAGIPAVSGGWKELGRTTLGSAGTNITVSSLANKRYYMILSQVLDAPATTWQQSGVQLGIGSVDAAGNYAQRYSADGAADVANAPAAFVLGWSNLADPKYDDFHVGYIANESDKEKLVILNNVCGQVAGAGNTPSRSEVVGKWTNTSAPLDIINMYQGGTVGGSDAGSELVVLGWDPADTHTTNFWEELADISLTSTNTSLDSGTFTAKKYLWVQMYQKGMTGNNTLYNFNSDTGSNYARRWRIDGGTEWTTGSTTGLMCHNAVGTQTDNFFNMFIINNSANEKLVISSSVYTISTGAGSPPSREEHVGKWDNTSSQITSIQFDHGGSNFGIGSSIKVWGSD